MHETLFALSNLSVLSFDSAAGGWGSVLLWGFLASVEIAVGSYVLGLIIGMLGATGKLYGGVVARDLWEVYTTLVRAVPELVLILLLYYAGTDGLSRLLAVFGYPAVDINGLVAGIVVLGFVQGAYTTEVLRGAIKAIPGGQIEAGRAYGMSPFKIFRRITVPAMLPYALPGLANLWMVATKDTALLAVVGFTELTLATKQAAGASKAYMTLFLAAGAIYFAFFLLSNLVIRIIERRARRGMAGAM
jgi:polar amino acid transport system permease protein